MVNIEVSGYVKAKLEVIKEDEGHKSHDSVIRVLLLERMTQREGRLTPKLFTGIRGGVPKETKKDE